MVTTTKQTNANNRLYTCLAGLRMCTPLIAISGIFGTDYADVSPDLPGLGAVVTKSVTQTARTGNTEPRVIELRAGLLNAIGLHNPGVHVFIEREIPKYRCLETPVIASVAGNTAGEYVECAALLSACDEVHGIELNVSCPNVEKGVQFGSDAGMLEGLVTQVRQVVHDKPLIVKLTPNVTDIAIPALAAINGGADAISLINTIHGMAIDIDRQQPKLGNIGGGLSGIGVHPVAVYMVHRCYTMCCRSHSIPIIGMGGVATAEDALELILAGATCVGIGTAMFRDPNVFAVVAKGMEQYLQCKDESSVSAIIGRAASDCI